MKVIVLGGGDSPEREVSLRSARAVCQALRKKKNEVFFLDPLAGSFFKKLLQVKPDCVFIALHGGMGEGGVIQGLLESLGFPYTGSGVLASAVCLNKLVAKKILAYHWLPTPAFVPVNNGWLPEKMALSLPVVVKPASLGSTIGISIVKSKHRLSQAVKKALIYDREVFLEQYISG
ncbi:MAG: D-alanine--D-alanine ligase, partial [Candidatus Omnitrophica bacterium]|nr:D-alanine--D-alanine ligase [Candidatus Omnitrophota bacterium]